MTATADPDLLRFARLLRPFPTKRLADELYHVLAEGASITASLEAILRDPPTVPERWVTELVALEDRLEGLIERCEDVLPVLREMVERADGEFERAVTAMRAIMAGGES